MFELIIRKANTKVDRTTWDSPCRHTLLKAKRKIDWSPSSARHISQSEMSHLFNVCLCVCSFFKLVFALVDDDNGSAQPECNTLVISIALQVCAPHCLIWMRFCIRFTCSSSIFAPFVNLFGFPFFTKDRKIDFFVNLLISKAYDPKINSKNWNNSKNK